MEIYLISASTFLFVAILINYLLFKRIDKDIKFKARAFSQISDPFIIIDNHQRIIYWNAGAEKLYGYKSSEALKKNFKEAVGLEDDQNLGKPPWFGEMSHHRKGGKKIYVQLAANAIKNERGEKLAISILPRDITDRKRLEDAQEFLSEADVKLLSLLDYRTILKKISNHIVPQIADWSATYMLENGSLSCVSVAHRNIKNINKVQELHEKYLLDKASPLNVFTTLTTKESQLMETMPKSSFGLLSKNSKYNSILNKLGIESLMIVPLLTRGKVMGIVTFISCESGRHFDKYDLALAENLAKRTSTAVDNAQLYLRAQEAVRAREEFLSLASHELKTPLTSLLLQLQIVLRSISQDPLAKLSIERLLNLLKNAENQTKKLADLISNLLNVSRITGGRLSLQLKRVNLSEILNRVVDNFKERPIRENVQIKSFIEKDVIGKWDSLQLDQVITNLVSNALKYGKGKPIEIRLESENNWARIIVKDNGIGIGSKDLNNIFEPFSRMVKDDDQQGLGVGLYIVKQIVEAHRGRIKVFSTLHKGSTFIVELPINKD